VNCYYHPDKEPVGSCVNCGRLICAECKVLLGGKIYCNPCADALVTKSDVSRNLSWFERHLNWTMVLGMLGAYFAVFIVTLVIILYDPYAYYVSDNVLYVIDLVINLAIQAPVFGWALRKKNRSLWWLPLGLFVPFGWIVLLCLENRSEPSKLSEI
jgi:hypothetical protein